VVTGGEPLLQADLPDLAGRLRGLGRHVTIETNATLPPPDGLACDLASLSPKLSHARSSPPSSPAAVRDWIDRGSPYQLKFVVADPGDLAEVDELLRAADRDVPPDRILLMPEGTTPETLRARAAWVVDACKARGYRYGMRLQIELFGNVRGT
jgi:7-carboxy-7-deazaguanine synthase